MPPTSVIASTAATSVFEFLVRSGWAKSVCKSPLLRRSHGEMLTAMKKGGVVPFLDELKCRLEPLFCPLAEAFRRALKCQIFGGAEGLGFTGVQALGA